MKYAVVGLALLVLFNLSIAANVQCRSKCIRQAQKCKKACPSNVFGNACQAMCTIKEGTCLYDCKDLVNKVTKRVPKLAGRCAVQPHHEACKPKRPPTTNRYLIVSSDGDNASCKEECTTWYNSCQQYCRDYILNVSQNSDSTETGMGSLGHSCDGTCDLFEEGCRYDKDEVENTDCVPWRTQCYSYCPPSGDIPGGTCDSCFYYGANCAADCNEAYPTPAPTPCGTKHSRHNVDETFVTPLGVEPGYYGTFNLYFNAWIVKDGIDCYYQDKHIVEWKPTEDAILVQNDAGDDKP